MNRKTSQCLVRRLVGVLVGSVLSNAVAAGEDLQAPFLDVHGMLRTYCDSARILHSPEGRHTHEELVTRCFHRDGRFKVLSRIGSLDANTGARHRPGTGKPEEWNTTWGDHDLEMSRREFVSGDKREIDRYHEYPAKAGYEYGSGDFLKEILAVFGSRGELNHYAFAPELSNAEHLAYVWLRQQPTESIESIASRVWIRRSDRTLARFEHVQDGVVWRRIEVQGVRLDPELTDGDLSEPRPSVSRDRLRKTVENLGPARLTVVSALISAGTGGLMWLPIFVLKRGFAERFMSAQLVRARWRRIVLALVWAFFALLVLTGLSLQVDGGHPPLVVFVFVLAYWIAIAAIVGISFLAASHLAMPLARHLRN